MIEELGYGASVNRQRFGVLLAGVFVWASPLLVGQETVAARGGGDAAATPLTEEQRKELDRHRVVITDSPAGSKSRRMMAESLLELDFPSRIDVAIDLLAALDGAPEAICEAIVAVGMNRPGQLDDRLVDPLLDLLGHERAELSNKAVSALSAFRDIKVADQLGALASDASRPIGARVAAVEALARSTDRREVVKVLVTLTWQENRAVVAKVLDGLRQASRYDFGDDVGQWRSWWSRKDHLSEDVWLRDRLDLEVLHRRGLRAELDAHERRTGARRQLVATRIDELLRMNYLLTPQGQRETMLQRLLSDAMEEYRLFALGVVRERIAEGDSPGAGVREAVKVCLADSSAAVRVAGLEIVGNLKNPDDAAAVLDLLAVERDASARETAFRVLGSLKNPTAIPALVSELTDPSSPVGCVREAANALGSLGGQGQVASAIGPLRKRFAEAPANDLRLRESLLGAMALLGDPAFQPEFVANLRSDSPELLLKAIRGVEVVEAKDQLDALLDHLNHADPRVRQLAAKAVGTLGSDQAHLAGLIARLNPDVEDNEGVRNAAWEAFRAVLSGHFRNPPSLLLESAARLDRLPDRQIDLLEEVISDWVVSNNVPAQVLTDAREELVRLLAAGEKHTEAIPHLHQLWQDYQAAQDREAAGATRMRLVRACLRGGRIDPMIENISEVASQADADGRLEIADVVMEHLESKLDAGEASELRSLLERFEAGFPEGSLGPGWSDRLQDISARIPAESN